MSELDPPDAAYGVAIEEDDGQLRRVRMSPEDFRTKALNCGWRPRVIDLFLKRPLCKKYVAVGPKGPGRVLALVVE